MAEPGTPPEIHYEVLALHGERWLIDVVLRERGPALEEARYLLGRGEVGGVEVRREVYDPASGLATARVVFKRLKPKRPRPRFFPAVSRPPPAAAPQAPEPELRPRGPPPTRRAGGHGWLVPVGIAVFGGGFLAALYVVVALLA